MHSSILVEGIRLCDNFVVMTEEVSVSGVARCQNPTQAAQLGGGGGPVEVRWAIWSLAVRVQAPKNHVLPPHFS